MKGIIFNLAEEVVIREHGEAAWDTVLDRANVSGTYTSLGSYPDTELLAIVTAAAEVLGVAQESALAEVARSAIPLLAERYPRFFAPHQDVRAFVLTLNDIIHPEVRKLYPGADVPEFTYSNGDNGELTLTYRSPRQLCELAKGFIRGAAAHYRQVVRIDQPQCMLRGDDCCVLHCEFSDEAL